METVNGNKVILRFNNSQHSLLEIDKATLNCEAKFKDAYGSFNFNRIKKYEVNVLSYVHEQKDSYNTMKMVEMFEALSGEDFIGTAMTAITITADKSISRLRNIAYPMTLSLHDKSLKIIWPLKIKICRF